MTISIPKDSIPWFLQSYIVLYFKFTCAGCKACYIEETRSHWKTRTEEHLGKDKNSQTPKHLQEYPHSRQVSNFDCFDVIDCNTSHFRLQLKEAIHISWKKPILIHLFHSNYFCLDCFILSFLIPFILLLSLVFP